MLRNATTFIAVLVAIAILVKASWGRTLLSDKAEESIEAGGVSQPPPPPEIYSESLRVREQLLSNALIPSALPKEHRRLSSDALLRPETVWGTPNMYQHPAEVKVFIGIFTAATLPGTVSGSKYDYTARRDLIRSTWMHVGQRYKHVAVKFVVGRYWDPEKRASIEAELRAHGDFITLRCEDRYDNLGNKTRHFFREVYFNYPNVEYIIKADDDVLILPERLLMAADQWSYMKADYIGCANKDTPRNDPKSRSYNPFGWMAGKMYPLYFVGSIYVLSGRIVRDVVLPNFYELRTTLEDIEMSWWMLASDAVHFEDRRLCRLLCDDATVGLADQDVQGFPMKYWGQVMNNEGCTRKPKFPLPYVPVQYRKYPGLERMHELMV